MDEKILFSSFATGLGLIAVSMHIFWTSMNFLGFISSLIIGIAGFFLASSRFLIIYHTESRKKPYAWIILVIFASVMVTLLPFWCHETHFLGKEFKYCVYENLWDYIVFKK
ncbi:MAG: hypothetical protein ABID54_11270 [Pseudomonadota bacterium]